MDNKENNIDSLIKRYLESTMLKEKASSPQTCPSELQLCDYLENRLDQEQENRLLEHLADCKHCLALLELAQSQPKEITEEPASELIARAQNIVQGRPEKTVLSYKWPILAGISFILSFTLSRYFLQFLTLALVFSIKWIFDTGSTRTLIMIYEAWRKKDSNTAQRIIQDLRNKIELRK
ncbi:MAG: zf-HC2 domain-containing protein [Candidatus Omnitrophica bacterium]|nr:zf-HC2 domain-containing protein [Candidatus Omnitrophota bacterium]